MEPISLTKLDSNNFEMILSARIAELEHVLRRRDLIEVERSADQVDEVQKAAALALAVSHFDRESHQLREARRALRRIREGTFGICEQCEEDIHLKRLLAVPSTALCIHCQEAVDREPKHTRGAGANDADCSWRNKAV
ncbi:MAG TPA: TraR/DksA C4-type zinc finger protein [Bryobacteraceae bacterium]|nr:TraR/DksA C4-type zinc finger protein [Bryobacteraceae bacterium]